ncbi:MAG TPA: plastocyanin/azurin family copper-binding protein [Mycobacteriales bacterium]|nr:plastocyanin/azurin family copper-binding protein [Mycobacteriales bacterium]
MDVRRRPVLLTLAVAVLAAGPALYAAAAPGGPATTAPTLGGTITGTDLKHHHIGVKVTAGAARYKGRTITVVLHSTKVTRLGKTVTPAAIKRADRVTVTYKVNPTTHAVTAIKIVDTGPKPKPAPTPSPTPTQAAYVVHLSGSGSSARYTPSTLTVPVGAKVTVVVDSGDHTWTSGNPPAGDHKNWDSADLSTGQSFSYTFTTPGTYPFFCEYHYPDGMTGSITVG